MIIKSYTRKQNPNYKQLIDYINRPDKALADSPGLAFNINESLHDHRAVAHFFNETVNNCSRRAKNSISVYHDVLSPHADDPISPDILIQMGMEWLQNRQIIEMDDNDVVMGGAAVMGRIHYHGGKDGKNPRMHLHLAFTPNHIDQKKRVRLTVHDWRRSLQKTEDFQREHFPQLQKSLILRRPQAQKFKELYGHYPNMNHLRRQKKRKEREIQTEYRLARESTTPETKKQTRTQEVRTLIMDCLKRARSANEFQRLLTGQGLTLHKRGRTLSVEDQRRTSEQKRNKRYRLGRSNLDILDQVKRRLCEWQEQKLNQEPERERIMELER